MNISQKKFECALGLHTFPQTSNMKVLFSRMGSFLNKRTAPYVRCYCGKQLMICHERFFSNKKFDTFNVITETPKYIFTDYKKKRSWLGEDYGPDYSIIAFKKKRKNNLKAEVRPHTQRTFKNYIDYFKKTGQEPDLYTICYNEE